MKATPLQTESTMRWLLIVIGVVIALVSLFALELEWRVLLPASSNQPSGGWIHVAAGQTVQWFHAVRVGLF